MICSECFFTKSLKRKNLPTTGVFNDNPTTKCHLRHSLKFLKHLLTEEMYENGFPLLRKSTVLLESGNKYLAEGNINARYNSNLNSQFCEWHQNMQIQHS